MYKNLIVSTKSTTEGVQKLNRLTKQLGISRSELIRRLVSHCHVTLRPVIEIEAGLTP